MATVYVPLYPETASFLAANFPQFAKINGTNIPVVGLAFDAAASTPEAAFWTFPAINYASGNLTVRILWYADTATTNDVVWGAAIAAITPNTDTQDIETDALATENTATDTHLGTTGQRLHEVSVTVSNLDSIAANDYVVLRLRRLSNDAGDNMAGDAIVVMVVVSYSDV